MSQIGIRPMLAMPAPEKINSPESYFAELKYDGERALAVLSHNFFALYNRRGMEITKQFPELVVPNNGFEMVIDGEIIVNDGTKSDFQCLQPRLHLQDPIRIRKLAESKPVKFVAFDTIWFNGDMTRRPLIERRPKVAEIVMRLNHPHYRIGSYCDFYEFLNKGGDYEGLVLKKKNSTYQIGKRSSDWLKIKNVKTMDCIIIGYTNGEGSRAGNDMFGALVLGCYENGKMINVGKVGTGFREDEIRRIKRLLKPREEKTDYITVEPELVCEVKYLALSKDKKLRQPVFLRLRGDKTKEECTL
jgi:bifunctional non-homologous end joining protein LigD